jgi:hypothetical protein
MRRGDETRLSVPSRLLVLGLSRERVPGGLDIVKISIGLLLLGADLPEALFELLCGCEPRQEWEVGCHPLTLTYDLTK